MISIDNIVRDVCLEMGDDQYKLYYKYQTYVIRGLAELNIWVIPNIISKIMPINDNYTVDLMDDVVKVFKVGIIVGNRVVTLGIDNSISLSFVDPCPCETFEQANEAINNMFGGECCGAGSGASAGSNDVAFNNVYAGNVPIGVLYGTSAGFNYLGYYREDYENRRLIIDPNFDKIRYPNLVIEQKVSGLGNSMALVRDELRETLIAFARWKSNVQTNPTLANLAKNDFIQERQKVIKIIQTYSLQQNAEDLLKRERNSFKR
jgi:hypothetical protein